MDKFILKKLYDIRPTKDGKKLDYEWIKYGRQVKKEGGKRTEKRHYQTMKVNLEELAPRWEKEKTAGTEKKQPDRKQERKESLKNYLSEQKIPSPSFPKKKLKLFSLKSIRGSSFSFSRSFAGFLVALLLTAAVIPGFSYARNNISLDKLAPKDKLLSQGMKAYDNLLAAKKNMENLDASSARVNFQSAYNNLDSAHQRLGLPAKAALMVAENLPGTNMLSSGKRLLEAGKHVSKSGIYLTRGIESLQEANLNGLLPSAAPKKETIKLGTILNSAKKSIDAAYREAKKAQTKIKKISPDDFPQEYQPKIRELKKRLPELMSIFEQQKKNFSLASKLLGSKGYKKYLILFQNNTELRPTGGFIGSYAEITINNGQIVDLKIDGIYSIDGQLTAKIEPPTPIKKISSAWSTHDSNWFFDFPTSAQKAMYFYEKTGQNSVDGVIALSPEVLKRVLKITGPIRLEKYNIEITSTNFLNSLQQHVEEDYNKMINRPKKILADLTPKIIEKISLLQKEKLIQLLAQGRKALDQKEILLYAQDKKIQSFIETRGWGGNVYSGSDDYLAVVNSNINGYKTDRYIDQKINLEAELQKGGKIKHKLTITRTHTGGAKNKDWYNKVNADYMRIFLPQKSIPIDASGFTREKVKNPIDYEKLNFQKDALVEKIEKDQVYDSENNTYISTQHNKKVIGGWVYTSPGHSTKITLTYITEPKDLSDGFSYLLQKQPGQPSNQLKFEFKLPPSQIITSYSPQDLKVENSTATFKSAFEKDTLINLQW